MWRKIRSSAGGSWWGLASVSRSAWRLLAAATAYAGPLVLALTAIPMLIIANAYRR